MAKGWKIVTVLPATRGGAPQQEWLLVAIADKNQALRAVKARHLFIKIKHVQRELPHFAEPAFRDGTLQVCLYPLAFC